MSDLMTVPPEWLHQKAMWTCWPHDPALWPGKLMAQARGEIAAMVKALADGEAVHVLAGNAEAAESAQAALGGVADIVLAHYGDIWLRDTGPVFAKRNGQTVALRFRTNGWGGKFIYAHDDAVGDFVAKEAGAEIVRHDLVLEGGSLEHDGEGTLLTTRECLANPNRNPSLSTGQIEAVLKNAFGFRAILWLDGGMLNDHTDGHIDNVARFVRPGQVVCQIAQDDQDPNAAFFDATAAALSHMTDASGRALDVVRIASPGRVEDDKGAPVPASHMNFIIGNNTVVVPTYHEKAGERAVAQLQELFPRHKVIGLPARALLTGGGSFHCITQQEPA
jgi:agmatine deiminase